MLLKTPNAEIGNQIINFELNNPSGKAHKLEDLKGTKGTLIAFICNHCPYVVAIVDRLVADAKTLQSEGVNVIAICSNDYKDYPADSPEKMKEFSLKYGFTFPYLVDEDQAVGKAYGAICTPDFFGYNSEGKLQYRGRLDDARMEDASNRKTELVDAMREIAQTGMGPAEQFPSMGCSIKWSK